jgi:hypothetical protein
MSELNRTTPTSRRVRRATTAVLLSASLSASAAASVRANAMPATPSSNAPVLEQSPSTSGGATLVLVPNAQAIKNVERTIQNEYWKHEEGIPFMVGNVATNSDPTLVNYNGTNSQHRLGNAHPIEEVVEGVREYFETTPQPSSNTINVKLLKDVTPIDSTETVDGGEVWAGDHFDYVTQSGKILTIPVGGTPAVLSQVPEIPKT